MLLWLPLKSKARPRCPRRGGRPYLPVDYQEWRKCAEDQLKGIWSAYDLPTLECCAMRMRFYGPGRHDLDNLQGSFLDAGLPNKKTDWRGCWKDDRVTVIPEIHATWHRSKYQYTRVTITPLAHS